MLVLGLSLGNHYRPDAEQINVLAIALLSAITGMVIAQGIRHVMTAALFQRIFFWSLPLPGVYIVFSA